MEPLPYDPDKAKYHLDETMPIYLLLAYSKAARIERRAESDTPFAPNDWQDNPPIVRDRGVVVVPVFACESGWIAH